MRMRLLQRLRKALTPFDNLEARCCVRLIGCAGVDNAAKRIVRSKSARDAPEESPASMGGRAVPKISWGYG